MPAHIPDIARSTVRLGLTRHHGDSSGGALPSTWRFRFMQRPSCLGFRVLLNLLLTPDNILVSKREY